MALSMLVEWEYNNWHLMKHFLIFFWHWRFLTKENGKWRETEDNVKSGGGGHAVVGTETSRKSIFFIITQQTPLLSFNWKPESDKRFQPFMEMEKLLFHFLVGGKKGNSEKSETHDILPLSSLFVLSSCFTFYHCFTAWIIPRYIHDPNTPPRS